MNNYLTYSMCGSLGAILQICIKINVLKNSSKAANHAFSYKEYFKDDLFTIIGSFTTVAIAIICIDEIIGLNSKIGEYVKWFFVFVGYTGSSIIQVAFSVTAKKIQAIVDVKTNIADGITPVVNPSNVEGAKEIQKDIDKVDNATG